MAEVFDFGLQQHKIKMDGKFFENNLFAVVGDTGRRLEVQLLDSDNLVQDTTGISLRLNADVAGKSTYAEATLVDATQGLYKLDLSNGMLLAPGNWQFQWQIIGANGEKLHSFAFTGNIGSNISEGGSQATNFYLNLEDLKAMQEDLKVMQEENLNKYPFYKKATLKHDGNNLDSVSILKKTFLDIALFNVDKTKKYYINAIYKNVSSGSGWTDTFVKVFSDGVVVAEFNKTDYNPTTIEVVQLEEKNNSGITGDITIDWSQLPSGTGYYNMGYNETGVDIKAYKEILDKVEVLLPPYIFHTNGKELNIYFDNIIRCNNLSDYQIKVVATEGNQFDDRWRFIPSATADWDYPITINVMKNFKEVVATGSTIVKVKMSNKGVGTTKNCLFIGDSFIDQEHITGELIKLFDTDVMDISLLGSRGSELNKHEGRSGWTANDYVNKATVNGVTNAFYSGGFSFGYYMNQQGYTTTGVSYVVINLGINDVAQSYLNDKTIENINLMIKSIHAFDPLIKIGIGIATPPSKTQYPFGEQYSSSQNRNNHKNKIFELNKAFINSFKEKETQNIYLVPINVNLDTANNFPTEQVAINSRNSATITVQSDAIHPAPSGYYQIADMFYYWIKSLA